jgi:Fe-S cluster biosynthesis and repair protein YggX
VDVVVHICNPSTWEAKTEGSQVQSQPGKLRETLYKNKVKKGWDVAQWQSACLACVSLTPSAKKKKKKKIYIYIYIYISQQ